MVGTGEEFTTEVSKKTEGAYTCTATSQGFPPLAATIHLRLRGPPSIRRTNTLLVKEGHKATLRCVVESIPHPVALTWYRGGALITSGKLHQKMHELQHCA